MRVLRRVRLGPDLRRDEEAEGGCVDEKPIQSGLNG